MRVGALLRASSTVTLATVVVNLLSYIVVAAGTRALGPERYGELAALLGLLLVGAVPAGTVQVVLARRVAAGERGGLGRAAIRTAVVVAGAGVVAVPALWAVLHISLVALGLLVLALPAITLGGALMGVAQGLELFGRLAAATAITGVGRVGGMLGGLAVGGTTIAAMVGLVVGSWLGAVAGLVAVRGPGWRALVVGGSVRRVLGEVGHASVTMLALAAIMTADVLLAKRYLPAVDAGLYGAGAVVTKAALWLPYAITMVALPRLAVGEHRRATLRLSILVLVALGVVEVAGVLAFGDVLFPLAVGAEYRPVSGWLWLFAVEGTMLAIAQLVIMSRIAAVDRLVPVLLWVGLLAEVGTVAAVHGSVGTILTAGTVTAAVVVAVGLLVPVRPTKGATTEVALNSPLP